MGINLFNRAAEAAETALESLANSSRVPDVIQSGIIRPIQTRINTARIAKNLKCTTTAGVDSMPQVLSRECLATAPEETDGVFSAQTRLFFGHWLPDRLHGTDIMFALEPLLTAALPHEEEVVGVDEMKFIKPITCDGTLSITSDHEANNRLNAVCPDALGKVLTRGAPLYFAFHQDPTKPIRQHYASNVFVDDLCAQQFARATAEGRWKVGVPVALDPLDKQAFKDYCQYERRNSVSLATTGLMDVAITGIHAFAMTGQLPHSDPLGRGFSRFRMHDPHEVIKGGSFVIDEIGPPRETSGSNGSPYYFARYPVSFSINNNQGGSLAQGVFEWVNRTPKNQ